MQILIDCLWIILGLALLWFGANWLVSSATGIAMRLKISAAVIGGTVVALGTSMPELVSTSLASVRGNPGIAYGTVIGSNICNILLILGLSAMIRQRSKPLRPSPGVMSHDAAWLIVSVCLLGVVTAKHIGFNPNQAGTQATGIALTWVEGLILLTAFLGFMSTTIWRAMRDRRDAAAGLLSPEEIGATADAALASSVPAADNRPVMLQVGLFVLALALLALGADRLVTGSVALALELGIPELVIGLTVVAVGTSMPELATSIIASRKGQDDLSISNVTGSNIQNILVCLGLAMVLAPGGVMVPIATTGSDAMRDFWVMAGATLFLIFTLSFREKLGNLWGWLSLALFVGYTVWLIVG